MPTIPVRVSEELKAEVQRKSEETGVPVSEIIRFNLELWVAGKLKTHVVIKQKQIEKLQEGMK